MAAATRASPQAGGARAARLAGYRDPVMWVTVAAVFAASTVLAVSRYARRSPGSWDLGIFTEAVKQYGHFHLPIVAIRGDGFDLLGDHFHPAIAVLGPVFRLLPSPVTLLAAQALLTAVSVIPVSRAGTELLGVVSGRLIGAAYGFSWGLASLNWYDFHEVALAVPLLAFSLSALARRRTLAAAWWAVPLVFVKEDQGFTVAAIGVVAALAYRARIAGALLAVWGVTWSLLAIYVFVPHFNPSHQYPYWGKGAHLADIAGHLAAGPAVKIPTLVLILLPTAFAALGSPIAAVAVPGLLLRFVSADTSYWGTGWHYNATLMPVVFAAAVDGLARIRAHQVTVGAPRAAGPGAARAQAPDPDPDAGAGGTPGVGGPAGMAGGPAGMAGGPAGMAGGPAGMAGGPAGMAGGLAAGLRPGLDRHAPAMMAIVAAALAFQFPLQYLWSSQTYQVSHHVHVIDAAIAMVPNGTTVEASLNELAPLAARDDTYWIGNQNRAPRWILFDQRSPEWSISNVPSFVRSRHPGAGYRTVLAADGVWLLKRTGGP
jgi:uncharacterized membrane protein